MFLYPQYTEEEQDNAINVLSKLVQQNQALKAELLKAQQFAMRMLMCKELHKDETSVYFYDDSVIEYEEDCEKISEHFFIDFYNNSNLNVKDGLYLNKFQIRIKANTSSPPVGTSSQIYDRIKEIEKRLNK